MNKKRICLSLLLPVLIGACGPTVAPATPAPSVEVPQGGFAPYVAVPAEVVLSAPAYTPNLAVVANPGVIVGLSQAQRAALEANGFVVVPYGYEQIYDLYQDAEEGSIPAFVTTDSVLHTFHILYDYALRMAEMDHLIGDLQSLTSAMLESASADSAAAAGVVEEAARQRVAFFAVAARLLDPQAAVPEQVQAVVAEELELIEAHAGISISPLFGTYEDYSQYVPRGHYTRNESFERYFRAMMWYGRITFHLTTPADPQIARRETRAALMIVRALHSVQAGDEAALDLWERIYEPTAFFVGTADDLTIYDYAAVAREVYGGLPDPAALADEGQLQAFAELARELRPPAIVGGLVSDQEDPEVVTQGFRFMGQRFIPDSYVFQQLVYDQVGLYQGDGEPFTLSYSQAGPIRGFPRGLDVAAVLGSARALDILTAEGDTAYDGYDEQIDQLRTEFAALPQDQWTSNLYWNWLYSLSPLLEPKGAGYPYFMQSPAWLDRDLHTWMGSWTELRHDTILYAKQSYTIFATAAPPQPEPAQGYVEPQPEVYARLAALTAQMRAGLGERGLLRGEMDTMLEHMEQLLRTLLTISQKELRGEGLTEEEYAVIRTIGDTLEALTTFSEEVANEITSEADERMALIADVHTDPNTGQVLEEGVGDAFPIYVVVMVEGQQVVARGAVFSYYEFKWPMSDRLTDEAWQELSPRPDRPVWTAQFIVE